MKRRRAAAWWAILGLAGGGLAGCGRPEPPAVPAAERFRGTRLVVGGLGAPALLRSVAAQRGEWVAKTGSELALRDAPVDPKAPGDVDVVVFAAERLGDLVDAGALAALPDAVVAPPAGPPAAPAPPADDSGAGPAPPQVDTFRFADIAPAFRNLVGKYGPDRFGLPIGGSALVVASHRGALDRPELVEAARAAGVKLGPPATWDEFDALARFCHGRDLDGDGRPDSGVALPWGPDPEGVGDAVFLARAAAAALHPDQYSFLLDSETTEPRVASPPFVEALGALAALKQAGPPGGEAFDAPAARAAFRAGRVALLVDRAEAAALWGTGGFPIGVAPLPGSARVYDPSRAAWETPGAPNRPFYLPSGGGWLVGVAAESAHREAAEAFARYLAEPETTDRLRSERDFPMLAVRTSQLARGLLNPRSAPGVDPRAWADAVARTLGGDKAVPGLRVPDAPGYLADVAAARAAVATGRPAEAALHDLAAAWAGRTRSLGLARQTWHHRRSLVGPSTAARPPAR